MKNKMNTDLELVVLNRKSFDFHEVNYNMNVKNILTAQPHYHICLHIDIINRYNVKLFIELGMYMGGGLAHIIPNIMLDSEFRYMGYEIDSSQVRNEILNFASGHPRCEVILEDLFLNHNLLASSQAIANTNGAVYVFCDGGNKLKELQTFSKFLRVGDIISVHDYVDIQTGEIVDTDFEIISDDFAILDEELRKDILWLPTFIKIK